MKANMNLFKLVPKYLTLIGLDLNKFISLKNFPKFLRDRKKWKSLGGELTHNHIILSDYGDYAGTSKGHYFHQDLLVASFIFSRNPKKHVDVGSRIDGFVAHVASFRKIEVLDVRCTPKSQHKNISFIQADLMKKVSYKTDSLSCLHAIEHFGLGRYSDDIDINGHLKGIENLVGMLKKGGVLYISFPIGAKDEIHFNAHRVFHPESILDFSIVKKNLTLLRFDFVDDDGNLHKNYTLSNIKNVVYGCGIYTFEKR